jgi:hypothetical protein
MLSRLAAFCLVALVLAPCTAPFQTCDLPTLLGHSPRRQIPANTSGSTAWASDVGIANGAAVSHTGRVRVSDLSRVCRSTPGHVSLTAILACAARRYHRRPQGAILTVLRV